MTASILSIRSLSAVSELGNGEPILRDVNLDLKAGETLGLVGESGAGKSTIAKALLGVLPRTIRITQGEILFEGRDLRTAPRRETRAIGFPPFYILMREILPNVVPALLALVSLEMGIAVIVEAILSFVGLSVSSDTPTWGGMIAEGRQFIHQTWWVFAAPLAALFATVLAFNQLGDGLRRALDPVLKR